MNLKQDVIGVGGGHLDCAGTEGVPGTKYYEGPVDSVGDSYLHQRFFSYRKLDGWVAGKTFNVTFTLDALPGEAWHHVKDFNRWQNSYGHYYSGVVGDLEGKTLGLSDSPGKTGPHQYRVARVIPEHLIVLFQPIPEFGSSVEGSPDCHVFMLVERQGRTMFTAIMEHAAFCQNISEEEALHPWKEMAPESQRKWRDIFIPTLKNLVSEQNR